MVSAFSDDLGSGEEEGDLIAAFSGESAPCTELASFDSAKSLRIRCRPTGVSAEVGARP
jgi:hypothetical protein